MELKYVEKPKDYTEYISNFLLEEAEKDILLKNKIEKTDKKISDLLKYVKKQAEKEQTNGVAIIRDDIVFNWAKEFILDDNIKIDTDEPVKPKEPVKPVGFQKPKPKKEHQPNLFDLLCE